MIDQLQTQIFELSDDPQNIFKIAHTRACPGILILSSNLQILTLNQKAWGLFQKLHNEQSLKHSLKVPPGVSDICAEVQGMEESRRESVNQDREVVRLVNWADQKILLRAFRFRGSGRNRMFLILIETVSPRKIVIDKTIRLFNLTHREMLVVNYIARGATNKEIGAELKISEQTVKVHIHHIMEKTNTTTRTGILTRVLHFQNPFALRTSESLDSSSLIKSLSEHRSE